MMLHNLTAAYVTASVPSVPASVRLNASLLMTVLIYTASNQLFSSVLKASVCSCVLGFFFFFFPLTNTAQHWICVPGPPELKIKHRSFSNLQENLGRTGRMEPACKWLSGRQGQICIFILCMLNEANKTPTNYRYEIHNFIFFFLINSLINMLFQCAVIEFQQLFYHNLYLVASGSSI